VDGVVGHAENLLLLGGERRLQEQLAIVLAYSL
jgi:hypothetical protein